MSAFNHVGQCVTDLERSKRFYCDLFGFTLEREINPPDDSSAKLMSLTPPMSMTAAYLVRDGLVLELLHYAAEGQTQPFRPRTMNEPGLTHLSLSVDDIPDLCARIPEFGGEVVESTNIGAAVFVRDPDGQLLELLPMTYREHLESQGYH
jgi:catechol 2,3-dioxygenase-like lactoylglutathione lyase family enzyme